MDPRARCRRESRRRRWTPRDRTRGTARCRRRRVCPPAHQQHRRAGDAGHGVRSRPSVAPVSQRIARLLRGASPATRVPRRAPPPAHRGSGHRSLHPPRALQLAARSRAAAGALRRNRCVRSHRVRPRCLRRAHPPRARPATRPRGRRRSLPRDRDGDGMGRGCPRAPPLGDARAAAAARRVPRAAGRACRRRVACGGWR